MAEQTWDRAMKKIGEQGKGCAVEPLPTVETSCIAVLDADAGGTAP